VNKRGLAHNGTVLSVRGPRADELPPETVRMWVDRVVPGTDLVVVADLLGHARLDTVRACTRPTDDDRTKALNLLPTDR
jgi:hypothetical protein